jgi:SNF2 family DNA or RNA helicase
MNWLVSGKGDPTVAGRTPGGLPFSLSFAPWLPGAPALDSEGVALRLEHCRLRLLHSYEELLCLQGLQGVEQLPHQIETVRRVLRHYRGRVLLADEVGLGKTIEACLLLREYLLRGLARRVLVLVPPSLIPQWEDELSGKFGLRFEVAEAPARGFWAANDLVLASLALARSRQHLEAVTGCAWDLVIVDEAHHCKNRQTRNWQLVNALRERYLFLLTATPVQNDLLELYNLLTLLRPGHLKTERDFKRQYVRRGNPRDPRNRQRLRELLGEVMVRNTRSLVHINLPPRYAQTITVPPSPEESRLYHLLESYLRWRCPPLEREAETRPETDGGASPTADRGLSLFSGLEVPLPGAPPPGGSGQVLNGPPGAAPLRRMQINHLLLAAGSHPAALAPMLESCAASDPRAAPVLELARAAGSSAKERKLVELLQKNRAGKTLVFANFRATLNRLAAVFAEAGLPCAVFSGAAGAEEKQEAVRAFRERLPVLLCSDIGGEGHNLQFCQTLINFDLPWNPMRIEQRVGRIHRYGQTREVFVFNLCTQGSLEERILRLLHDKVRMFELVVGEIGSILGNLEGGEEFESLVFDLWRRSRDGAALDREFERLGEALLQAQEHHVQAKSLDEALFGEDFS